MTWYDQLDRLALMLSLTPTDKMRVERGRDKWWLCGAAEGDQPLPGTAGCRTVQGAVERAERWLGITDAHCRAEGGE